MQLVRQYRYVMLVLTVLLDLSKSKASTLSATKAVSELLPH
jgi:hypothetical protein